MFFFYSDLIELILMFMCINYLCIKNIIFSKIKNKFNCKLSIFLRFKNCFKNLIDYKSNFMYMFFRK